MKAIMKSLKFLCVFVVLLTTIQFMHPLIVNAEAAPPVSNVTITRAEYNANGQLSVFVRVVGYGEVYASIDGRKVNSQIVQLQGNPVHAFVYRCDCGSIGSGNHTFVVRVRSLNRPWNTLTQNAIIEV